MYVVCSLPLPSLVVVKIACTMMLHLLLVVVLVVTGAVAVTSPLYPDDQRSYRFYLRSGRLKGRTLSRSLTQCQVFGYV